MQIAASSWPSCLHTAFASLLSPALPHFEWCCSVANFTNTHKHFTHEPFAHESQPLTEQPLADQPFAFTDTDHDDD